MALNASDKRQNCFESINNWETRIDTGHDRWLRIAERLGDAYESAFTGNQKPFKEAQKRNQEQEAFIVEALSAVTFGVAGIATRSAVSKLKLVYSDGDDAADSLASLFGNAIVEATKGEIKSEMAQVIDDSKKTAAKRSKGKQQVNLKPSGKSYETSLKTFITNEMNVAKEFIIQLRNAVKNIGSDRFKNYDDAAFNQRINKYLEDSAKKKNRKDLKRAAALLLSPKRASAWSWGEVQTDLAQGQCVAWAIDKVLAQPWAPTEMVQHMIDIGLIRRIGAKVYKVNIVFGDDEPLLPGNDPFASPTSKNYWQDFRTKCFSWRPQSDFASLCALLPPARSLDSKKLPSSLP